MDKSVAQILFQALLDHQLRARTQEVPRTVEQYPKGFCISYGNLVKAARLDINPLNAGGYLFAIADKCLTVGWPPLHAIAVNRETGMPGTGFFRAPGTTIDNFDPREWERCVLDCIRFDEFPKNAPTLG